MRRLAWGLVLVTAVAPACSRSVEAPAPAADVSPGGSPAATALVPVRGTEAVPNDPDDPAIWRHPSEPTRSLILTTDKQAAVGGLYVFGLDGRRVQAVTPLDRPNNIDVEYGVMTAQGPVDVAVVTERLQHRLRLFAVTGADTPLRDLVPQGLPVLDGQRGLDREPMGIALYKRPRDSAVFAIVAPKSGGATDYLWQYRLDLSGPWPAATLVRRFGRFSGRGPLPGEPGEIEAVVVDDELGYVYYADERFAVRKWHADPEHPDAATELATFGEEGYDGDREGLAIHRGGDGRGWIVSSDQVPGATRLRLYPREGMPGAPHRHPRRHTVFTPADATDGLDVVAAELPGFPQGLLVMMNSRPKNFLLFAWADVDRLMSRRP